MFTKKSTKSIFKFVLVLALLLATVTAALAQDNPRLQRGDRTDRATVALPERVSGAMLDAPMTADGSQLLNGLNPSLARRTGRVQVVVRLSGPSTAEVATAGGSAPALGVTAAAAGNQQDMVIGAATAADPGTIVLGQMRVLANAVMLDIDAAALPGLAADPSVVSINPVTNFEMDLSETVPYIGATAVQDAGYDGTGVRVGVIDSGVDYYHAALGGSGDPADYAADDPTIIEPGTFPTAKVVGGYDFVGGNWPNTVEEPDPDPLDDGVSAGHGTHVADIIGGMYGVAPGADIYALKVCSSVSTSCSGVAMNMALEWAVDPNGDLDPEDHLDIVNMSIGATMGNPVVDDTSYFTNLAAMYGVMPIVSAGNGSDIPYITGSPSSADWALSVAQTNVPSAVQPLLEITAPASIAGTYAAVHQNWSPSLEDTGLIEGPVVYAEAGNENGCAPYAADQTGNVVLMDRGGCNFTLKIKNACDAGAVAGIIGLVAPGDPFTGGDGGDAPITCPGFMISQTDSNALKSGLPDTYAVFDPAGGIPLVGHMVGSSSRGPTNQTNRMGPGIGAPGASISAIAGSGTGTGPFGGTSGAAPMVSGSAALLKQAYPYRSVTELKAVLVNTGETDIMNEPAFFGGDLAPISRIGGGEVRVDKAFYSTVAAWDKNAPTTGLTFGFMDVTTAGGGPVTKRLTVANYDDQPVTLRTDVGYRFDNDAGGEIRVTLPSTVTVPGNSERHIQVKLFVRPRADTPLHPWVMNSGSQGANPDALTFNEYDGYIYFTDVSDPYNMIHVPWHVLPRAAGDVTTGVQQNGTAWLRNDGVADVDVQTYSLIGVGDGVADTPALGADAAAIGAPGSQELLPTFAYVGVQTYPVPAGFCSGVDSFVMEFAVHTYDKQIVAAPTSFEFWLDTDQDGTDDYLVLNRDFTLNNVTDGRNLTWVVDLSTGSAGAFFFLQHNTNSANTVLTFCAEQIGMNAEDFFVTEMMVDAFAQDFYYGGPGDEILDMGVVPLGEQYLTFFNNGDVVGTTLPANSAKLEFFVFDFGKLNPTETGVLWLYFNGPEGNEAEAWMFE